jgi:hypothetical protein
MAQHHAPDDLPVKVLSGVDFVPPYDDYGQLTLYDDPTGQQICSWDRDRPPGTGSVYEDWMPTSRRLST